MRRLAWNVMYALAALVASGCGRSGPSSGGAGSQGSGSAAPTKLTVAAISIVDVAPLYLASAQGMFAAEGLEVTVRSTQGGAESVPGVVSGAYQVAFANVITILLAHAKGIPLKLIAAGDFTAGQPEDSSAVVVPADSPVKSLHDLEGKTLTVNQLNNIGGVTIRAAMRKAGGDPDKLTLIEARYPEMPPALAQHRIDAAWLVEPFLTVARDQGARVISWNFAETAPDLMVGAYLTTADYARRQPDVVKRFTQAINRALVYASEHPDAARAILLTYTKIDKAIAGRLNLPKWRPQIDRASLALVADLMIQDKLLTSVPDLDTLLP